MKQKVPIDMTNPAFKEPFKYDWKRELVYRARSKNSLKRMADIYYYTPNGKKVRSFREVAEFLHTKELTIDNFTFYKEPLGLDDPEKEIIRNAKRARDSGPVSATPPKNVLKKATPVKKIVGKPATPSPRRPVGRPPKGGRTPGLRVKLPGKRGPQKKTESPPDESEMLQVSPQWSSPAPGRRSQTQPVEKSPPAEPKRALTTVNRIPVIVSTAVSTDNSVSHAIPVNSDKHTGCPGYETKTPNKSAQNIALIAGKKYIVVPKNNAMAMQPAITVKPDKIGDKPAMLHDSAMTDAFGTNIEKQSTIPRSPINELINDAKMKSDESIQSEKNETNSGSMNAASNLAPNVSTSVVSNIASNVVLTYRRA